MCFYNRKEKKKKKHAKTKDSWYYRALRLEEKKKQKHIQRILEVNEKIKDLEEFKNIRDKEKALEEGKNIRLNDKERAEFIAHEIEYRNLLKWYDRVLILGLVIFPLSYFIGVHLIALGKYLGIF